MKICAVVVTYNRIRLLKENVKSLLSVRNSHLKQILIVNNGSTDGTTEWLNSLTSNMIDIIVLPENIGGAGGFSTGVKHAAERGFDYAWIMDDDTIVYPNSLDALIDTANSVENMGFVCSKALWTDGNICKMNIPRLHKKPRPTLRTGEIPVRYATFVSLLISIEAIKIVGLPYKEYFIWNDDIEYTWRLGTKGYNGYYNSKSVVVHKMEVNYGSSIDNAPEKDAWRFYYQMRNQIHFKRLRTHSYIVFFISAYTAYKRKMKKIKMRTNKESNIKFQEAVRKGFWDGLKFNPSIEYVQ